MNGPSGINQWPAPKAAPAASVKRAVAPEVQERLLLARLFGLKQEDAQPPVKPAAPAQKPDDEFAPNLGRHLDVIA